MDPTTSPAPPPSAQVSSNLYLVTFLATLFLLLAVSCLIVLRSFLLRRRYHRRVEQARAAGLFLAPRAQGSRRRRLGHRPPLRTAYLSPAEPVWPSITPLASQPVFVKRRLRPSSAPAPPPSPEPLLPTPAPSFLRRLWRPVPPTPPQTPPPAGPRTPVAPPGFKIRIEMLQVAVLVAMPSQKHAEDDARLPELVIGVTRAHYRPDGRPRSRGRDVLQEQPATPQPSDDPRPASPGQELPLVEDADDEDDDDIEDDAPNTHDPRPAL